MTPANGDPAGSDELVTHDGLQWHRRDGLCAQCARGVPVIKTTFPVRTVPRRKLTDRWRPFAYGQLDRGEL